MGLSEKELQKALGHLEQDEAVLVNEINRLEALLDRTKQLKAAVKRKLGIEDQPPLWRPEDVE